MYILAIESSCDETSAAVLTEKAGRPVLRSNVVSSQIDIHQEFGGVVPEVAARAHIENIIPVIKESLREAKIELSDVDYFAVTAGPGLVGSLVVGVETVKAIALAQNKPIIALNHLEGHLYANFVNEVSTDNSQTPAFPLVALLVSGGHSMLIHMPEHLEYEIIGNTKDDAAGEAFDKAAKILGLGYPGGPAISIAATKGNPNAYNFPVIDLTPRPSRDENKFLVYPEPSLDFSFSGLKTALITEVKKIGSDNLTESVVNDLVASFQQAVVASLTQNALRAIEKYKPKTFILSGGVAANKTLRETLGQRIAAEFPETSYLIPETSLCTDNAGMLAAAAYYHLKKKSTPAAEGVVANPNMKLS